MRKSLLALLFATPAFGAVCEVDLSLELVEVEQQLQTCEDKVLIRGSVADRKDYPGVVWIGNCTATLIGPRTVVTAAHCTRSNARFTIGASRFESSCVTSSQYPRNATADWSICYTNREVPVEFYENLSLSASDVAVGDEVLLSGFGCQQWGGRLDGQYRVGKARVSRVPSGNNHDIVAGNGATLCSGDSGGPLWSLLPNGDRDKLLGVNSRSDTRVTSYVSSFGTEEGRRLVNAYISRNPGVRICGVHADAPKCRNAKPLEPKEFVVENEKVKLDVRLLPGASFSKDETIEVLNAAINEVKK